LTGHLGTESFGSNNTDRTGTICSLFSALYIPVCYLCIQLDLERHIVEQLV
jgi:hypothetical protein